MTEPLSIQEMLEHLRMAALTERALIKEAAISCRCSITTLGFSQEKAKTIFDEKTAEGARCAQTLETMAAILEVQSYPGFRRASRSYGMFTIRLMLANGKGGTLADFRDANPVVAWLSAYEAIKAQEVAVPLDAPAL